MKTICIIGAKGSGKSAVTKALKEKGYHIVPIITNKKPTDKEGEYFEIEYMELSNCNSHIDIGIASIYPDEIITFRAEEDRMELHTFHQLDRGKINILETSPEGAERLKEKDKDTCIIYLQADEEIRIQRLAERLEDKSILEVIKNYKQIPEIWSHIINDRKEFKNIRTDYVINSNRKIENVIKEVIRVIEGKYKIELARERAKRAEGRLNVEWSV